MLEGSLEHGGKEGLELGNFDERVGYLETLQISDDPGHFLFREKSKVSEQARAKHCHSGDHLLGIDQS